jgi:phage terminase Nu1 subunit (DNA packaging protein)
MSVQDEAIWTRADLAAYLKVHPNTVDNLRATGLPCFHIGRLVRFEKTKVLHWLRNHNGRGD